jgi:hypothetical protein
MRAAFRTWAEEIGGFDSHIIEQALAHTIGTAVERAYRRTDLLARRSQLMAAWASYLAGAELPNVVKLKVA